MINFREIFNSSYGYLFLVIIFVLFLILIFVKREILGSFKVVSNILFISGILCLVISIVFRLGVKLFIDSSYQIFVRVISDNLCSSLLYRGIIHILISIVLYGIYYYFGKKKEQTI